MSLPTNLLLMGRTFGPAMEKKGRYRVSPDLVAGLSRLSRDLAVVKRPGEPSGRTAPEALQGSGVVRPPERASGKPRGAARRLPVWLEQLVLALLRPGNRRRGTRPVQTELCFDTVRVVRNDLTMADMEMVARREPRPALSAGCRTRVVRLWWEQRARQIRRLSNALF